MKFVTAALSALLLAASGAGCSTAHAADTQNQADAQAARAEAQAAKAEAQAAKVEAQTQAVAHAEEQRLEAARKRLEEAAREVAELSSKMATERMPDNLIFLNRNPNRAMLGIAMGGNDETETEAGVAVMSVSPGGPAADAGLKSGDIIVEINGKSLKREKGNSPNKKLVDEMAKLSPGDEATLKYTREGKTSIAKLKVDKLPQVARREIIKMRTPGAPGEVRRFEFDGFENLPNFDRFDNFVDVPHIVSLSRSRSFGEMELVPLTPKLAQYFGTDKGLLVVRAPESKDMKLEDGDVLLDIDGRVPSNAGHAFRILGSYQAGEKVTLNVQRQKKKTSLAITVPEQPERAPHAPPPPRPPREPRAPSAPAPGAAPAPVAPPPV